ncbi:MAG: hypothetical protein MHM6MM_000731 [Cercozoa sp. M6MM]
MTSRHDKPSEMRVPVEGAAGMHLLAAEAAQHHMVAMQRVCVRLVADNFYAPTHGSHIDSHVEEIDRLHRCVNKFAEAHKVVREVHQHQEEQKAAALQELAESQGKTVPEMLADMQAQQ